MKRVLWHFFNDLASAIVFLIAYAVSGNVRIAGGSAIAAAIVEQGRRQSAARQSDPTRWMSLGLVAVLGGATMLTQNPRFFMLQPSFVHLAVAGVMLWPGWMTGYITPIARQNVPEATMAAAGYAWAALMAALGLTNLAIVVYFDLATWAWFVLIGAVGAKLAAIGLQYAIFRAIVRRRLAQSAT